MSKERIDPRDRSLSLMKAGSIVREYGISGFENRLPQFGLITAEKRNVRVRELYEESWKCINEVVIKKDDEEASPAQRILGTLSAVWQMRDDPDLANVAIFSFFLHYRLERDPCGDLFGVGFVPTNQQEFDERLYQLCYDSRLLGEMPNEPHDFARVLKNFLIISFVFLSGFRDASDYLPIEELELRAMSMFYTRD